MVQWLEGSSLNNQQWTVTRQPQYSLTFPFWYKLSWLPPLWLDSHDSMLNVELNASNTSEAVKIWSVSKHDIQIHKGIALWKSQLKGNENKVLVHWEQTLELLLTSDQMKTLDSSDLPSGQRPRCLYNVSITNIWGRYELFWHVDSIFIHTASWSIL